MKFTDCFGVTPDEDDDWFDPILSADTQLFVDPFRVYVEDDERWAEAHNVLVGFFNMTLSLVAASGFSEKSARWKKAKRLLRFPEPAEFCLGYGDTPLGLGTGEGYGSDMLRGAKRAIQAGIEDV